MERIVVGVDGSPASGIALRWAIDEARCHQAALEAVYAWHDVYIGGEYPIASTLMVPTLYEDAGEKLLDTIVEAEDQSGLVAPISRLSRSWHSCASGTKLAAALAEQPVSFEVDRIDENTQTAWSVLVSGRASVVTEPALPWRPSPPSTS